MCIIYSVIVPCLNEQDAIHEFYARLKSELERLTEGRHEEFQIIFVDDGSTDLTFSLLREIAQIDSGVVARIGLESATLREVVERLPVHAEQAQCPAPPPHSKDEVSGKELGGIRCRSSASRQSDVMGNPRGAGWLAGGTSYYPWRAVQLFWACDRNRHDAALGISLGTASDRGVDGLHLRSVECAAEHA